MNHQRAKMMLKQTSLHI